MICSKYLFHKALRANTNIKYKANKSNNVTSLSNFAHANTGNINFAANILLVCLLNEFLIHPISNTK